MSNKSEKLEWKKERPLYLILAIVGAIIALVIFFIPKNSGTIKTTSLAFIDKLILRGDPKLEKIKGGEKILLQIRGYDKLFQIAGFDFNQKIKRNILDNIHSGDTISLKTDSAEFRSLHTETFFDKFVELHSLTKDGREYLDIDRTNLRIREDLQVGIPLGLYLIVAGLVYWSFRTRPKISAKIAISLGALILIFMLRH